MSRRLARWGALTCTLALALPLATPAGAAPVVAGITARRPASVHPDAERAFLAGAATAEGVVPPPGPATRSQQQAAVKALEQGEAAYLEFKLKNAETALNQAVEGLLASPGELEDGEPAVRAALLLAQVLVARKQPDAAELVLERALQTLPGFPRGGQPPPDILSRIDQVRERMADRLTARLTVETEPPGADVRLNGVPVGRAPVQLDQLAPGPVRITISQGDRRRSRQVELIAGPQTQRLGFTGVVGGARLLTALAAGDEAQARRAAKALQGSPKDEVCAGLVIDNHAWLLRFSGAQIITERDVLPAALADWERLGRRCGVAPQNPTEPEDIWLDTAALTDPLPPTEPDDHRWAYTTLAGGAVAAGVGAWLGLQAQDAADDYNQTGATAAEDDARRNAILADVAFTAAVGLVATGIYLLVSD